MTSAYDIKYRRGRVPKAMRRAEVRETLTPELRPSFLVPVDMMKKKRDRNSTRGKGLYGSGEAL
ncbi:MAG: hypothetical protein KGL31_02710 [candidate division NC10 bacterium]|nr:hypothetical protein [candidate division NC10 bacterium]MDE2320818.1 hypothetical protein [candidate division NC10 bacterium]